MDLDLEPTANKDSATIVNISKERVSIVRLFLSRQPFF